MDLKFSSVDILGVRVDRVTPAEAVEQILEWVGDKKGKPARGRARHYIVTPNIEFIMKAQKDLEFKKVLNQADLCIPDSSRIGWAARVLEEKGLFKRFLLLPFCLLPKLIMFDDGRWMIEDSNLNPSSTLYHLSSKHSFPTTTGTDLIYFICEAFSKKGLTVGFLGGREGVAEKAAERLQKRYPGLKVVLAEEGGSINDDGRWKMEDSNLNPIRSDLKIEDRKIDNLSSTLNPQNTTLYPLSSTVKIPPIDLLFVAFGQGKQEKWIAKNLPELPVKVMMGVGGAFDYISGSTLRAPLFLRKLGLEWLFRLIIQPWRIKRQIELIRFVWKILF